MKEVVMGSRLRDGAPHGGEDSLQLQRDVMIVLLHARSFPPGAIQKLSSLRVCVFLNEHDRWFLALSPPLVWVCLYICFYSYYLPLRTFLHPLEALWNPKVHANVLTCPVAAEAPRSQRGSAALRWHSRTDSSLEGLSFLSKTVRDIETAWWIKSV